MGWDQKYLLVPRCRFLSEKHKSWIGAGGKEKGAEEKSTGEGQGAQRGGKRGVVFLGIGLGGTVQAKTQLKS